MKTDQHSPATSRDVAKRTHRSRRAYVMCSPKNGFVEVRMESRLEQSVAQVLELDPRVRSYRAQPFTLDLSTGELLAKPPARKPEKAIYYTPDFSAALTGLEVIIEVKPRAFLDKHVEQLELVRQSLLRQGLRLIILCEDDFPGHYLRNIQLLMPYLSQSHQHLTSWAERLLHRAPYELQGRVADVVYGLAPANYFAAAGMLLGVIKTDLTQYLFEGMDFPVEPAFGSLAAFEVIRYEP
jgi:hypothetical protein